MITTAIPFDVKQWWLSFCLCFLVWCTLLQLRNKGNSGWYDFSSPPASFFCEVAHIYSLFVLRTPECTPSAITVLWSAHVCLKRERKSSSDRWACALLRVLQCWVHYRDDPFPFWVTRRLTNTLIYTCFRCEAGGWAELGGGEDFRGSMGR